MLADTPYFDTCYLARLYLEDAGFEAVRDLAGAGRAVASAWHARTELIAALHRVYREHRLSRGAFQAALAQFVADSQRDLFDWLPLTEGVHQRVLRVFRKAPATAFLRSADALHLACAAENGFETIYSNDRHLLAAAPLFELKGVNIL